MIHQGLQHVQPMRQRDHARARQQPERAHRGVDVEPSGEAGARKQGNGLVTVEVQSTLAPAEKIAALGTHDRSCRAGRRRASVGFAPLDERFLDIFLEYALPLGYDAESPAGEPAAPEFDGYSSNSYPGGE